MSWRELVRFYSGIVIVSMTIALGFAAQGAWLVLPFAGLEMLVLGIALYSVARRSASWQEIAIDGDRVKVISGGSGAEHSEQFQRGWVRVVLEAAPVKGHPSRLLLGSHGRTIEIGGCLNEDEKHALAVQLRRAVQL
jgi:uncharacterized membrane protein